MFTIRAAERDIRRRQHATHIRREPGNLVRLFEWRPRPQRDFISVRPSVD